jgi:predicted site-specific integrase-resolvase
MTNQQTNIPAWWDSAERLTHDEAAELIGVEPHTFTCYLSKGRFVVPRYKYGKKNYYRKSEILTELARHVEIIGVG